MSELFSMHQVEAWGGVNNRETQNMVYILNLQAEFWGPLPVKAFQMFIGIANTKIQQLIAGHASELGELRLENTELKSRIEQLESSTDPTPNYTRRKLELVVSSYHKRCHEFDNFHRESVRNSIIYSESMHAWSVEKKELSRQIEELKGQMISESIQANILRELEKKGQHQETERRVSLYNMVRHDRENPTCPVPTRGGELISLKRVYNSWEIDGIETEADEERLPAFKDPQSSKTLELVSLKLIDLFHLVMNDLRIPNDPPFKLQYKTEPTGEWRDILFSDQIRIASTMFQMKHKQVANSNMENRLVHNNLLLVSIFKDECNEFKYEIRESHDLSKTIPSQMIQVGA